MSGVRLILTILFRTVLALLPLIAVAAVALRVLDRPGGRADRLEWATAGGRMTWVESRDGWLRVVAARPWPESRGVRWLFGKSAWSSVPYGIVLITPEQLWGDRSGTNIMRGHGYAVTGRRAKVPGPQVQFAMPSVPHWIVATACALPPLAWSAVVVPKRLRLRRRQRRGLCLVCGYDLRGSPERCPECGKIPAR
jgi:hypothetical protein